MIAWAYADCDSGPSGSTVTLTGTTTLEVTSYRVQKLDPAGAHRNVVLPSISLSKGLSFDIVNKADAAENLVLKDENSNTIVTVGQGQVTAVFCDGFEWIAYPVTWSIAALAGVTITGATISTSTLVAPTISDPVISRAPGASTAAAGNATGNAGVLPAATSSVYPTTAADDTKGVRVHADDTVTGRMLWIGNGVSNKILKVYPPTGGTINGGAGDAAFSSVSGKGVVVYCLDSATNAWLAW